jgi:DNA-binding transcriptional ArsR family regulator
VEKRETWKAWGPLCLMLAALVACTSLLSGVKAPGRGGVSGFLPTLPALGGTAGAAGRSTWALAAAKVKEERGEPTGRQAEVDVPEQLKHYSDRRRFLGIQTAEWKEHDITTPQDFAGLARLISGGELVEVAQVSENHVLYGVGALADEGRFTHYDEAKGKRVALYAGEELAGEYARLEGEAAGVKRELDALRAELKSLGKRERTQRKKLMSETAAKEKSLKTLRERKELLDTFYGNAAGRRRLEGEYEAIASLARDFAGRSYDAGEAASRKQMKVRMLSHLRPEALKVLEELARSYKEKFDRPLPVTSLVRPDEYQRQLGAVNANATRIETPPHSTGLAFDILYRYMTAEEQAHVMADIARLRDAGRVEALRENRDHFHVFAFLDGQRPGEDLIRASLGDAKPAETKAKPREEKRAAAPTPKKNMKTAKAASRRAEKKQAAKKETGRRRGRGGRA